MVTKNEYEEELKQIDKKYDLNKGGLGLDVKKVTLRTDSNGKTFVIFKTATSILAIAATEVQVGMPESLIKDDTQAQLDRREKDKQILQERVRQEALKEEMKKHEAEIRQAMIDKQAEVQKEAGKKVNNRLRNWFGGK